MATAKPEQRFVLNFEDDTPATVSRSTLRALAERLGLNDTQAVLLALARLRDEVLIEANNLTPLTRQQHEAIAKAESKTRGKVLDSLVR